MDSEKNISQGQISAQSQQHSQTVPSGGSLNHPLRPLSTLDSGMYTSSDESDHDEPPHLHLESHPQSPSSQRLKFTTFGKVESIQEETLFEEGTTSLFLLFEAFKIIFVILIFLILSILLMLQMC